MEVYFIARKKDTPQKAALREMMGNYLKENNVKVKDGTDVNSIMRDMISIILEGALDQEMDEELDGRKQELVKQIAELTVEAISPEQVNQISGYLDTWDSVSFDDKRRVVDLMITTVAATSDSLNITWKI